MGEQLITFRWLRGVEGVEWVKAAGAPPPLGTGGPERWWLVPSYADDRGEWYYPLRDELALFRAFADTPPTQAGIEAFVEAYGTLGIRQRLRSNKNPNGEAFADWRTEIEEMRDALDVWEALRNEPARVREWFRFGPAGDGAVASVVFERGGAASVVVSETDRPELWQAVLDAPKRKALNLAASFYVQAAINDRLTRYAAPRLLYNPDTGEQELRIVPGNLLGALWWQFARAVEGGKGYARCEVCGGWFEVSTEGKRPEAKHCSTNCRVKAYRARQGQARDRAAAGEPVEDIATDLGSDIETVRGWINKEAKK